MNAENSSAAVLTHERPCRHPGIDEEPLLDELLLYASLKEMAYTLNSSARLIWEGCDGSQTVGDLCVSLGEKFGCPAEDFEQDVTQVISRFRELGLIDLKT